MAISVLAKRWSWVTPLIIFTTRTLFFVLGCYTIIYYECWVIVKRIFRTTMVRARIA